MDSTAGRSSTEIGIILSQPMVPDFAVKTSTTLLAGDRSPCVLADFSPRNHLPAVYQARESELYGTHKRARPYRPGPEANASALRDRSRSALASARRKVFSTNQRRHQSSLGLRVQYGLLCGSGFAG